MAKENFTKPWIYAIWAIANLAVGGYLALHFHPATLAYIISGLIFLGGIGIMLGQIIRGGDTTGLPYAVQTGALVFFLIWCGLLPA